MRKYLCNILAVFFLLVILPPVQVRAAGGDGFGLDEKGTVTVLSRHAAKEEISSLCFSLQVESADADRVEFQFEADVAEVQEFRYDEDAKRLNVYVAGTEALFAAGTESLTVGRIVVLDTGGREAAAKVNVVEDSLQYVYGSELKTMQDLDLPGTVQIGSAGGAQDSNEGQDSDGEQDSDEEQDSPGEQTPPGSPANAVTAAQPSARLPEATPKPPAVPSRSPAPAPTPSRDTGDASQASDREPQPSESGSLEGKSDVDGDSRPGRENTDRLNEEKKPGEINVVALIAVIAIILFAIAMIFAVAVLKKVPKRPGTSAGEETEEEV